MEKDHRLVCDEYGQQWAVYEGDPGWDYVLRLAPGAVAERARLLMSSRGHRQEQEVLGHVKRLFGLLGSLVESADSPFDGFLYWEVFEQLYDSYAWRGKALVLAKQAKMRRRYAEELKAWPLSEIRVLKERLLLELERLYPRATEPLEPSLGPSQVMDRILMLEWQLGVVEGAAPPWDEGAPKPATQLSFA